MPDVDSQIDVRHRDPDTEFERVTVDVGGHTISIREEDGDPHIYVYDHATIRIEGEHKDEVTVVVGEEEFPTTILRLSEREFWDRYNDDSDL